MGHIKTPCRAAMCRSLVNRPGFCDEHKNQYKNDFDKTRLDSTARGYDSKWRKARNIYIKNNPLCVHCESNHIVKAAKVVDHIKAHKGDYFLFWDRNNWQSLCESCHNRKTATQDSKFIKPNRENII